MKLSLQGNCLTIERTGEKEKYYTETAFYYEVKKQLQAKGFDVIKANPGKDGNLTSLDYYIVDRKRRFCFADLDYQIRLINQDFNKDGKTELSLLDDDNLFTSEMRNKLNGGEQ